MQNKPANPGGWSVTERRFALTVFGIVTALITLFLLRDARAFVNSAQDALYGHLGASGGFTIAATGALLAVRGQRPPLLAILLSGAAITVCAELAQGLVPSRGVELRDVAAGFGGVLVAAVGIECILQTCTRVVSLRVHTLVAAIASTILLTLLVFDLVPETLATARPDGDTCPLTTLAGGDGGVNQSIAIGPDRQIDGNCLRTNAGGFGLFGPDNATSLNESSVLVSSPLDRLFQAIVDDRRLEVRAEFVTGSFPDEPRPVGVIMILRSEEAGELLHIRTHDTAIHAIGPSLLETDRTSSYTQILRPNTRYRVLVELTATELQVTIDGVLVSTNTVDPGWIDVLAESDAADDLTLYIGNGLARTQPFQGVIEWLEIDT